METVVIPEAHYFIFYILLSGCIIHNVEITHLIFVCWSVERNRIIHDFIGNLIFKGGNLDQSSEEKHWNIK